VATEQEYSGISDIFRLPKFSYYFFQSQRDIANNEFAKPMVYIASYWQPNVSQNVRVFSNCTEVELFVDDKSVGRQKPDNNNISKNLRHAPFTFNVACTQPGSIKAVGYSNGQKLAEQIVNTPSTSNYIDLQVDESGMQPTRNDVVLVYANLKDAAGTTVVTDSSTVSFEVEGAQIVGSASINAQAGTATILIRTSNSASDIHIKAKATGLKPATTYIKIK
jgi:beta-galactosidase